MANIVKLEIHDTHDFLPAWCLGILSNSIGQTQERKHPLSALQLENIIALLCIFVSHKVNSQNSSRTIKYFYGYLNYQITYCIENHRLLSAE